MNREFKVILFVIFTTGFSACACASTDSLPPYFPQDKARACFPDLEGLKAGEIIAGYNWSWGKNVGWLNVKASGADLQIDSNILSGKAWMENCGWVGFGSGRPFNGKRYGNERIWDWGVNNDGSGNLSGYAWSEYQSKVPAIIAKYGGRYLVRGGKAIPFAGDWKPERILVVQFDSMEQLRKCFESPEYRALAPLREKSTISQAIFVEGLSPDEIP